MVAWWPRLDDPEYFKKRCNDLFLPDGLMDKPVEKGFNSMALLAFASPEPDALEPFLVAVLGRPLIADPTAPLISAEAAALRLYHLCKSECAGVGPSSSTAGLPAAIVKKTLTHVEVAELMQKFMEEYPSELKWPNIMPSGPMLLLVGSHSTCEG